MRPPLLPKLFSILKASLMEQIMFDDGNKRIFAEVEFAREMWIAVITEHFMGII